MTHTQLAALKKKYSISISEGNMKLKSKTGEHAFLIFNLPAIKTCPEATQNCKRLCYARKAERIYPNALQARENNYIASLKSDFVANMNTIICGYMELSKNKNIPVYFRIHEAGDFYSPEYFNKWVNIMVMCKHFKNLHFNFYTKSIDFISEYFSSYEQFKANIPNCGINISVWDDSPEKIHNFINSGKWPVYTASTAELMPELLRMPGNKKCTCKDCARCRMCLYPHNSPFTKICEIH